MADIEMNWDLTSYFAEFDGPEMRTFREDVARDLADLQARAQALETLRSDNQPQWEEVLLAAEDLWRRLSHMSSYLSCLTAADVRNEAYKSEEAAFAHTLAEAEKLEVEFKRALKDASDVDFAALAVREELADCHYYLSRLRQEAQRTMSPPEERLAADLSVDGLHAWGRIYDTVSGKMEFDMVWPDGKTERLPMSQRRSLMGKADRAIRKAAFDAGNESWRQAEDVAAAALNAISGTRLALNSHRGIDHFLDVALFQSAVSRESLDAMFEAIFDSLELPRRILRLKAASMNRAAVAWHDLEAPLPLGEEAPIDWARATEIVHSAFAQAYPKLGEYTRQVFDSNWIDWEPRPGKRPGGFCTGSLYTNEPRIFMTYNESAGDVRTLAHEAGHAFHHFIMKSLRPFARQYPMTLAESASTFGEMILTEGILNQPDLSDIDRARVLDMETAHGAIYLLDIPVRFEFEKSFHEERQAGEVEVSRIKELMGDTQRRIFGDLLEPGGEDPYFWASKLHFYITGVTFYNFPYTFGFLLSRGLFAKFKEQGPGFLPRYEEFLRLSGSAPAADVARRAIGCDLESPDFWKSAIETLREPVEQLEALLPKLT